MSANHSLRWTPVHRLGSYKPCGAGAAKLIHWATMKCSVLFMIGLLLTLSAAAHARILSTNSDVATKSGCETSTSVPSQTIVGLRISVVICRNDEVAWIAVSRTTDGTVIATESKHFSISSERVGYGFGVDGIVEEAPDRFHVQFTYGNAGTPTSDTFRFVLRSGKWRTSGRDRHTMAACGDGSIGVGESYSIDYLTGKVLIDEYRQCRYLKVTEGNTKKQHVWLSQFDPFDPTLE